MAAGAGGDTSTSGIITVIMRGGAITYGVRWFRHDEVIAMYQDIYQEVSGDAYVRAEPPAPKLKALPSKPWHQSRAQQWKNNRKRAR